MGGYVFFCILYLDIIIPQTRRDERTVFFSRFSVGPSISTPRVYPDNVVRLRRRAGQLVRDFRGRKMGQTASVESLESSVTSRG